nr:CDP-glucose 4,6-dehydratase [Sphingomonas arenae]
MTSAELLRVFAGRRILLTGHTGFKGGWLTLWLNQLGAEVRGVSLPAESTSFFETVRIAELVQHRIADIRDPAALAAAVREFDPELVIHMAAQAIVRSSFDAPLDTLATNVMGTANVLEAVRRMPSCRGVVVVTSDKCYRNTSRGRDYRETDPLGGDDPYSASKACTEIVAAAWRQSFFRAEGSPLLATVRAGNVFGGGDWARDRIVPDLVRGALTGEPVRIRYPRAIRPWQHVLEPVSGYLQVAARLLEHERSVEGAWNFGPGRDGMITVGALSGLIRAAWGPGEPQVVFAPERSDPPEKPVLRLDSSKSRDGLGWKPALSIEEAVELTVEWYRAFACGDEDMRALSEAQIERYVDRSARREQVMKGAAACV